MYSFKKIKDSILTNPAGVQQREESSFASKERVFLDVLYLHADYVFDHLDKLDWDKVFEILPVYGNKRITRKVRKLHRQVVDTKGNYETGYNNP